MVRNCESLWIATAAIVRSAPAVYATTVSYAFAILLLTHWPQVPEIATGGSLLPLDKIIHWVLYAGLGFLLSFANRVGTSRPRPPWLALLAATAVFAAADELTQTLTGRSPEILDWVADLAGAAAGLGLGRLVARAIDRQLDLIGGVPLVSGDRSRLAFWSREQAVLSASPSLKPLRTRDMAGLRRVVSLLPTCLAIGNRSVERSFFGRQLPAAGSTSSST